MSLPSIARKGYILLEQLKTFKEEFMRVMNEDSNSSRTAKSAPEAPHAPQAPVTTAPIVEEAHNVILCPQCSAELIRFSKFCPECGSALFDSSQSNHPATPPNQSANRPDIYASQQDTFTNVFTASQVESIISAVTKSTNQTSSPNQEQTSHTHIYDGVVHKCPNCGEVIDPTDAVCDSCGFRVAGRSSSASAQLFSQQLLLIEQQRPTKNALDNLVEAFVGSDDETNITKQKIELIKTFPIPNTVEELTEFMFMADANINVKYSKKRTFLSTNYEGTTEKKISDAWISKMKQIYSKAKMAFSDDPIFQQIEEIYTNKMDELGFLAK